MFYSDVAPIIRKKCTICHNPNGSGPVDYISYEDVEGRRTMFKYVIENDLMPPWQLDPNTGPWDNDNSLTSKEKAMLLKWIDDGCPKKSDKKDLLAINHKKKPAISNLIPDYEISLPKIVKISTGVPKYIRFLIKANFTEDKWIRGLRFILKPKVIHHSAIYIMNPTHSIELKHNSTNESQFYKSILNRIGKEARTVLSDSIGINIPRKATILWELHYDPQGQKVTDNFTHVQFFFHKKRPKYQSFQIDLSTKNTHIPPLPTPYIV